MANKPRGWGLKAIVAGPLRRELFFAASLTKAELPDNKENYIVDCVKVSGSFLQKL